jgi:prophage regulatory protein
MGYIRQAQLLLIIPFSAATLWRKVADASFPAPVKLSERVTAWEISSIKTWMQDRVVGRG